jgi:uncharacterized protein involved in outer membrane biogenesis
MPSQQRSLFSRIAQAVAIALAGVVVLLLLAVAGGALWLSRTDLKPFVEREASAALGRRVTLGSLHVHWSDPLAVDLTDLDIANAPWGSTPEMVHVGRLSALLDVSSLLHGTLRYERLRLGDVKVVLEHDRNGAANWKFGGGAGGLGLVPKNRTQFPTLIDFAGEHGLITYRTRNDKLLRIQLDRAAISSAGERAPARLTADGAYNDVAARLEADTDSYAVLRDAGQPFGARFTLKGKDTDIAFDGTLQEPLDYEGVKGRLSIDARTLDDILGILGSRAKADLPLSAAGLLKRDHEHWSLTAAKGRVQQSGFSGDLALREAGPREPDEIGLDLAFDALDLDSLAAAAGGGAAPSRPDLMALRPDGLAGVNISAALKASTVTVAKRDFHAVTLHGRLAGGEVTLQQLSFALGGGTLAIAGSIAATGADKDAGTEATLQARLSKVQVGDIARELGAAGNEIRGGLDGAATLDLRGETLGAALDNGSGAAILTLHDGDVARSVIEKVSVDLRRLFRSKQGRVQVSCLLGVATLGEGVIVLSPLRLETPDAVVVGAGKLDLLHDRLDLTVKSERDSTSFFALDLPIRISGPLDQLTAKPLIGSDTDWLEQHPASLDALPPALRTLADRSPCLSG